MFLNTLQAAIRLNDSLLCVGLDSDGEKIPKHLLSRRHPVTQFNKAIVDATHNFVAAYKPNAAFYESRGEEGIRDLHEICTYVKKTYPGILLILDAKRADIGNTNEGYAKFAYDYLGADAVTLHPYLGKEALLPFLNRKDKGCIILCRTSNPGAGEFQDLETGGKPLYLQIAERVSRTWNGNGNCMLVVGATYPDELASVRNIVGEMPILVPGIGAQGGDLEKTLAAGLTSGKSGLIISVSRSVIFADPGETFADAAQTQVLNLHKKIQRYIGGGTV